MTGFHGTAIVDKDEEFVRRCFSIISHYIYPWRYGDKINTRKKLNLPLDKYILFVFGQKLGEELRILGSLRVLSKRYNILLLIVSLQSPEHLKENGLTIEFRKEAPDLDRLSDYLPVSWFWMSNFSV